MLNIVHVPDPVLTSPALPVTSFNEELASLIKNMEKTLVAQIDPQGVGLAAPQVASPKALFIMKPSENAHIEVCINPRIVKIVTPALKTVKKPKKKSPLEGCLSIPHIWAPVKRARKIILEYQDQNGRKVIKTFSGFKAIIVQHEVDHLQGVLFTQRALEQHTILYEEKNGKLKKMDY